MAHLRYLSFAKIGPLWSGSGGDHEPLHVIGLIRSHDFGRGLLRGDLSSLASGLGGGGSVMKDFVVYRVIFKYIYSIIYIKFEKPVRHK